MPGPLIRNQYESRMKVQQDIGVNASQALSEARRACFVRSFTDRLDRNENAPMVSRGVVFVGANTFGKHWRRLQDEYTTESR